MDLLKEVPKNIHIQYGLYSIFIYTLFRHRAIYMRIYFLKILLIYLTEFNLVFVYFNLIYLL